MMLCPLCGGPLHVEDDLVFACERGHSMDAEQMRVAASARVTTALWMAIEALETEAAALRTIVSAGSTGGGSELADQAEADARLLRGITKTHLPPEYASGGPDGDD